MKKYQRVLLNACIISGITFLSTLSIDYPPTMQNLWAAGIGAGLALLTQLKTLTSDIDEKNPPLMMLV